MSVPFAPQPGISGIFGRMESALGLVIRIIIESFQKSDWSSGWFAPGGLYEAKMAASSRLANVSDEKIAELNISAVPKSTQYATKYGVKILKVRQPL